MPVNTCLRLPDYLHSELKKFAQSHDTTVQKIIIRALIPMFKGGRKIVLADVGEETNRTYSPSAVYRVRLSAALAGHLKLIDQLAHNTPERNKRAYELLLQGLANARRLKKSMRDASVLKGTAQSHYRTIKLNGSAVSKLRQVGADMGYDVDDKRGFQLFLSNALVYGFHMTDKDNPNN